LDPRANLHYGSWRYFTRPTQPKQRKQAPKLTFVAEVQQSDRTKGLFGLGAAWLHWRKTLAGSLPARAFD
jgi:hypothetical protein